MCFCQRGVSWLADHEQANHKLGSCHSCIPCPMFRIGTLEDPAQLWQNPAMEFLPLGIGFREVLGVEE